jgi:hypothetical protein
MSCLETIRPFNLLAENNLALRLDQRKQVPYLDVSEHVVLDASLHGHWLPVFVLDTGIAAVSREPLQFQLQFLVKFSLGLLLFRLCLLLLCNFGGRFLAYISLSLSIRLMSELTKVSSFVIVELPTSLSAACAIEVLDMHRAGVVACVAVRTAGANSRVICRDILQWLGWY